MSTAVVENGQNVNDEIRGQTYYFPGGGSSASLWQRINLFISIYWKSIIVVLTPLLLLPIPILNNGPAYRCMYVVLIMAVFWVLELLPLPVTSMLPIVLFPTMGILDSDKTCAAYMKETNMMFMGGLMIAAGVQHSKLPKRVALWTVQVVGCSHRSTFISLTWGSVIFPVGDAPTALYNATATALSANVTLGCDIAYSSLPAAGRFNCTVPGNGTALAEVAKGLFRCDYLPYDS